VGGRKGRKTGEMKEGAEVAYLKRPESQKKGNKRIKRNQKKNGGGREKRRERKVIETSKLLKLSDS